MALNEVIRTSGDIRRFVAQTMVDVKYGDLSDSKGLVIAALSKEITSSLQVEINVAKVRLEMLKTGQSIGSLTHLGKMIIEDNSTPTLSGQ
jgi:Cys-tRNA synthase (O-phospho-L-seryl-tRNA:Cys-tRNA synthase)